MAHYQVKQVQQTPIYDYYGEDHKSGKCNSIWHMEEEVNCKGNFHTKKAHSQTHTHILREIIQTSDGLIIMVNGLIKGRNIKKCITFSIQSLHNINTQINNLYQN